MQERINVTNYTARSELYVLLRPAFIHLTGRETLYFVEHFDTTVLVRFQDTVQHLVNDTEQNREHLEMLYDLLQTEIDRIQKRYPFVPTKSKSEEPDDDLPYSPDKEYLANETCYEGDNRYLCKKKCKNILPSTDTAGKWQDMGQYYPDGYKPPKPRKKNA